LQCPGPRTDPSAPPLDVSVRKQRGTIARRPEGTGNSRHNR